MKIAIQMLLCCIFSFILSSDNFYETFFLIAIFIGLLSPIYNYLANGSIWNE